MAFNRTSARSNTAAAAPAENKVVAYMNVYLPTKAGGKRKLYGIPLFANDTFQANLACRMLSGELAELDDGTEVTLVEKVRQNLVIEVNSAERSEDSDFAI